jgi:hypothetical protein
MARLCKEWRTVHGKRVLVTICPPKAGANKRKGRWTPRMNRNSARWALLAREWDHQHRRDPDAGLRRWIQGGEL